MTTASVTASTGGVSSRIQSKGPCDRFSRKLFMRSDASSSEGFGGVLPAVITKRFGSVGALNGFAHATLSDQQLRQADVVVDAHDLMHAGSSHVGVDQQYRAIRPGRARWPGCTPSWSCPRAAGCW